MKTISRIFYSCALLSAIEACKQDNDAKTIPKIESPKVAEEIQDNTPVIGDSEQIISAEIVKVPPVIPPLDTGIDPALAAAFLTQNVHTRDWRICENQGTTSRRVDLIFLMDNNLFEIVHTYSAADCPFSNLTSQKQYRGSYLVSPGSTPDIWNIDIDDKDGHFGRIYTQIKSDAQTLSIAAVAGTNLGTGPANRANSFPGPNTFKLVKSLGATPPPCPADLGRSPSDNRAKLNVRIHYFNASKQSVEIFWRDLSGKEESLAKLAPNELQTLDSVLKDIFVVRDAAGACVTSFLASDVVLAY